MGCSCAAYVGLVAVEVEALRQRPAERPERLQRFVAARVAGDAEMRPVGGLDGDFVALLQAEGLDNGGGKTDGVSSAAGRRREGSATLALMVCASLDPKVYPVGLSDAQSTDIESHPGCQVTPRGEVTPNVGRSDATRGYPVGRSDETTS